MSGEYNVRRMGKNRFRIKNPNGEYVINNKGNEREFSSYQAAIKTLREYEKGRLKEHHPLLDDQQ